MGRPVATHVRGGTFGDLVISSPVSLLKTRAGASSPNYLSRRRLRLPPSKGASGRLRRPTEGAGTWLHRVAERQGAALALSPRAVFQGCYRRLRHAARQPLYTLRFLKGLSPALGLRPAGGAEGLLREERELWPCGGPAPSSSEGLPRGTARSLASNRADERARRSIAYFQFSLVPELW